mmetsp:Transcript_1995/g.3424  ORF Transcript_1995/g.3424 Transcript_1995/m.3424 type:complete len:181 (-) Transcript_1995:342-884(-)
MPPPQSIPDCYERLGLHPDATLEQVKKAYHQLALLRHPDVVPASQRTAAERDFKQISDAYSRITQGPDPHTQYGRRHTDHRRHADWSRTGLHTGPPSRAAKSLSPWALALFFSVPVVVTAVKLHLSLSENRAWIKTNTGRADGLLNPATNNFIAEDHLPKVKSSKTYTQLRSPWSWWSGG